MAPLVEKEVAGSIQKMASALKVQKEHVPVKERRV